MLVGDAAIDRAADPDVSDAPGFARRVHLAFLGPLGRLRIGPERGHVTAHARLTQGRSIEAVGVQRALLGLRTLGLVLVAAEIPIIAGSATPLFVVGLLLLGVMVGVQVWWFRSGRLDSVATIAAVGLIVDSAAAYLFAQAFVGSTSWVHFLAYPLVAIEGAVVLGPGGATVSTLASSIVYIAQQGQRASIGRPVELGATLFVVSMFVCFGALSAAYAGLTRRMRGDLEALLEVSTLLSLQESPTRIVQALDSRLRQLVEARIRSVAVRRADGGYEVMRWRTPETRVITPAAVRHLSDHLGRDIEGEIGSGRALTIAIEGPADAAVVDALGLPEWVRAITLVPIQADGELSGILPVLWDRRHVPSPAEMDLLSGFAQQTGLAFEQSQLHRARELAATDSLTGLANHRAFRDALAARVSEARRHGGDFAILFCDLDRFKAVNDRYGHGVGDLLLHRIATAVRAAAREEDLVARYGGDELALLLPGTGRFGALDLARRLREQVLAVENRLGVDLTIGVAVYPEDASDPDALVHRADAAMYAGKRLGGGRVVLSSELPPEA